MDDNARTLLSPLKQTTQMTCVAAKLIYYILLNVKDDPFDIIKPLLLEIKKQSVNKSVDLVGSELVKDMFYLANSKNSFVV